MRRSAFALSSLLLVAVLAGPALAGPPDRQLPPQPIEESFVSGNCGFDVQIDVTGKEGIIDFGESFLLIAPGQTATLTNLANQNVTTVNIAGPGRIALVDRPDGGLTSTLMGRGNWLVFNADDPSDPIKLVSGRFTIVATLDADGTVVSAEEDFSRARVVNLCEVLA